MARGEKVRRWAKRILLGLVALVVVLVVAGAVYEAFGSWSDARRFRPPGRLVDVGGRRIHLHCTGSGSPTVVLDAGLGLPSLLWRDVQPGIASFATVCSYDRAGHGYSDAGPLPRTLDRRIDDLRAALAAGGHPPPYVLVGHSAGGFLARGFRHRFPREVVGVVLVDSAHEGQLSRGPPSYAEGQRSFNELLGILPPLVPLGLPRLIAWTSWRSFPPAATMADELVAGMDRRAYVEAARSEGESFLRGGEIPSGANLGDVPLVVLTAGKTGPYGLPPADDAAFAKLWMDELQPELARLSSRGRRVVVDGSGPWIPTEKPQAVVSAVREVVEATRAP